MFHALLLAVALTQPTSLPAPLPHGETIAASSFSQELLATFIPVCRDGRGGWDRRACRHLKQSDPARLTLA